MIPDADTPTATQSADPDCASAREVVTLAPMPPLMVRGPEAAALCGLKYRHWLMLQDQGQVLDGVRFGRVVLFPVDELRRWCAAGCPPAARWRDIQ